MAGKPDPSFDGLPSYSESISSSQNSAPSLFNSVANARSALISTLVTAQVVPHFHNNVLAGLSNTSLLIVPTNVSQLQPPPSSDIDSKGSWDPEATFPYETVVGFPSAENITLIRLHGQENNLAFWCQPTVILELEQKLRSQLQSEGYRVLDDNLLHRTASNVEWRTIEKKSLHMGEASAEVGMKEISLRFENAMGLYETRTGKAVIVRVVFGG